MILREKQVLFDKAKSKAPSFSSYGGISHEKLANFHLSITSLRDQIKGYFNYAPHPSTVNKTFVFLEQGKKLEEVQKMKSSYRSTLSNLNKIYDKKILKIRSLSNLITDEKVKIQDFKEKQFNLKRKLFRMKKRIEDFNFDFAMNNALLNEDYRKTQSSIDNYSRSIRIFKALHCKLDTE